MNGLNSTADDVVECPLCMEPLEVDDLNFYPCTCGYQICRFCWHRIRTDENELCPACRKAYPENPADFTPLTQEEMVAFKSQKRQRDQQRKQKITENRKHLANVRVVQKNLVFVVGLPPRLADADILKKHEYFGKYGKIHKVVINPSTTYAGVQGPSASAYVTYVNNSDALRAIQSVNNINIDGRPIKTSLGTTKYCSHFMKNQQCPKSDCMYLHELGDPEASFTKEEMHQGKHQEYEKRLHETLLSNSALNSNGSSNTISGGGNLANGTGRSIDISKPTNGSNSVAMSSSLSSSSSLYSTSIGNSITLTGVATTGQQKEAWPSLSVSPINNKDSNTILNGKTKKDRGKYQEKLKNEKCAKAKSKVITSTNGKENIQVTKDAVSLAESSVGEQNNVAIIQNNKNDKSKVDKLISNRNSRDQQNEENDSINVDDEVQLIDVSEKLSSSVEEKKKSKINNQNCCKHELSSISSKIENGGGQRSLSSSSNTSIASSNSNSSSCEDSIKQSTSALGDNTSGKSSPLSTSSIERSSIPNQSCQNNIANSDTQLDINFSYEDKNKKNVAESSDIFIEAQPMSSLKGIDENNLNDTTAALSNLNLFDDHNSFFSSSMASLHQSLLLKNKLEAEMRQNHMNSTFTSQLPDLLSGIDGFQNNAANSDELEKTFKNVMMMRNSKQLEEQQQQLNQQQHQIHQQLQQQEEIMRIQEMQTRNNLINNMGISQIIGPHGDLQNLGNNTFDSNDMNRLSQAALLQQQMLQQQSHQPDHLLGNNLFGMNMSKFFDFHKNQQQQQIHQQFMLNGGHNNNSGNSGSFNDQHRLNTLLENNRINSQFLDQTNSLLSSQPHQLQKQRLKYDSTSGQNVQQSCGQPNQQNQQQAQQNQQQAQQSRITNQFSQNSSVDDDLGFDPFIETQKALAELMENELVQQQNMNMAPGNNNPVAAKLLHQQQQQMIDNMQRSRMPPPGFNHMNAFAFGVPHTQNTSKILPFMNGGNSVAGNTPMGNASWNSHLAAFPQPQPQQLNESQIQQLTQNQNTGNHKAYGNNDWTAMDPAILSFRQFSFPQQSHIPHPSQQDFFVQNMPQQQNIQGFGGSQAQLHCGNVNLPNGMINSQQASQSQVNANVQGMLEYLKNRQFI